MTTGKGLPRIWRWFGIALVALVVLPGAAEAASVSRDVNTLHFTAERGEANQAQITSSGTDIVIADPGAGRLVDRDGPGGCTVAAGVATCPSAGLTTAQVALRDRSDSLTATGNLAALAPFTFDAGSGDDTIRGGNGADVVLGGEGNDFIDGNLGNDFVLAGTGNDSIQWDPGDASDTLEGQADHDKLLFNGSNIGENVNVFDNGGRVLLTRDVGTVAMDLNDVEEIDHRSFGGADNTTVNDLSGTELTEFHENLAAFDGNGDAEADNLTVSGTAGADQPLVATRGAGTEASGLATQVTVTGSELANDVLNVDGLGGDDRFRARPGAASRIGVLLDGGDDTDTMLPLGTPRADGFAIVANGTAVFSSSDDGASGVNSITESLVVNALGGPDTFSATGNLAALTRITVDAGAGDDTVLGGNGPDLVIAGDGDDFVDGNQADDTVLIGAGNDAMQWDPGDGNDILEGQDGRDKLLFNTSNIGERVDVAANGGRVRLVRDIGNVTMDLDDVEEIDHRSFGGNDSVTVNDLSGTDLTKFDEDLGAFGGGGDAGADNVIVNGTAGADQPLVTTARAGRTLVSGLRPQVVVGGAEVANDVLTVRGLVGNDQLRARPGAASRIGVLFDGGDDTDTMLPLGTERADTFAIVANGTAAFSSSDGGASGVNAIAESVVVNGLGGPDTFSAAGNLAALTRITVDAGAGNDTVLGGNGADLVVAGDGNDFVDGNQGDDTVLAGANNDTAQWDPGDGNDTIEGQDGRDKLVFNGSNINERVDVAANGGRVRFTRDIASITMDLNDVEEIDHNALGGVDVTTINDMSGTDLTDFRENLSGTIGSPSADNAADEVIVNGTNADDAIDISGTASTGVNVTGLATSVAIRNQEPFNDRLTVHTLAGTDSVDTGALAPNSIDLVVD